ncbi:hypothetical protein BJ170DRAFT_680772 [Xylariales sp. AK1849]|nr:hypothetical protein BJ170DRAFT_680772 [Xylariales sp. AK1849]
MAEETQDAQPSGLGAQSFWRSVLVDDPKESKEMCVSSVPGCLTPTSDDAPSMRDNIITAIKSSPPECLTPPTSDNASPIRDTTITAIKPSQAIALAPTRRFRGQHPPAVWEAHKPEIRRMYIDDEMSLKEVRAVMEQKGFKATEKMYKDKLAKWGFNKNNRRNIIAKMVELEKQRKVVGKPTVFHRNGKIVDIDTYMRRAKLSPDQLLELDKITELPGYLRCRTPPPTFTTPTCLRPPGFYHTQTLLLRCFNDLGARADTILDRATTITAFANYPQTDFYRTVRQLRDASWLFEEGCSREGGIFMRRAFSSLHMLVEDPSPWAFCDLVMYQLAWIQFGHHTLIWKYLADYAAVRHGPLDWLSSVFRALHEFFQGSTVENCLGCLAELMGTVYPTMMFKDTPKNLQSFLQGHINSISRFRYAIPPIKRFSQLLEPHAIPRTRAVLKPDNPLLRFHALFTMGNDSDWRDERILDIATELHKTETDLNSQRLCLRALAYFHMSQWKLQPTQDNPRHGYAKQYLKQALDLAPYVSFGGQSGGAQREIWEDTKLLETWHREDGDFVAAEELRKKRHQALDLFVSELEITK